MGVVEDARFGGIDLGVWAEFEAATWTSYPLLFRMLDDAAVAAVLWDRFLSSSQCAVIAEGLGLGMEQARSLTALLAGLRELGKLVPGFQRRERGAWERLGEDLLTGAGRISQVPVEVDRSSMHVALGVLGGLGFAARGNSSPAVRCAQVVGGMGGRFLQVDVAGSAATRRVAATVGGPTWRELRARYAALVRYLTGAVMVPERVSVQAAVLMTGVGMLAGRLSGQRGHWLEAAHMPAFGAAEHFAGARVRAVEVVGEAELERVDLEPVSFATAHPHLAAPNDLQASLIAQLPGLVGEYGVGITVIADGTGSGKSVGALEVGRICNGGCGTAGVAWLMPTTATTDAAWETLEAYVRAHRPERVPVTLAHSRSRLNAAYTGTWLTTEAASGHADPAGAMTSLMPDGTRPAGIPAPAEGGSASLDGGAREPTEAGEWAAAREMTAPEGLLDGQDAALLAQFSAATIDQAQMAVLPVQFSALRLLALSGKTVVVDEAHALTPYSHLQLLRLLGWLGSMRTPVVLLSATMPSSTSSAIVAAYLAGAGREPGRLAAADYAPAFPGWLFADAATGTAHRMEATARIRHCRAQTRPLRVTMRAVTYRRLGDVSREVDPGERLAVIGQTIGQVAREGGCAMVGCATVADSQDTYGYLQRSWPGDPGELMLLHARFPGWVREQRTGWVRRALGPTGPRPDRLVVVTTSMLDTSLDIDVDMMVSDLASIARLLQRAGRLARFYLSWQNTGHRPPWWSPGRVPHLTVLQPLGAAGVTAVPAEWRTVEPAFLLHATAALLQAKNYDLQLNVPADVQDLVEQVHGEHSPFASETANLRRLLAGHLERTVAEEHLSDVQLIPPHDRVSALADLHRQYLTSGQAATRLGTLPRRLLPCYLTAGGELALDRAGTQPLPDQRYLSSRQVRHILQHTVPVPAAWVARPAPQHRPPASWDQHPLLANLVLLPSPARDPAHTEHYGRHRLRMDDELGLIHDRVN
ncbi:CRISPR-associated helicase/endonuclease Cas3 [Streptomyces sp. ID38640]|uniref:HD domain-containing protein n=1 Tax=Streptomyces sp. ID38640 TaxID=1265399 RepID=UPI00140EDB63|nr:HD domain-containing protein [Streptomyces sp. ID38640]QIK04746.1 CRISPR-associated helicase/endonuclease Cas3 [Streptomyces sp. ID38640]